MLKKCAIICEYNPLHNGHIKHMLETKKVSDILICIMSGNFAQRANIAILNKYARATHAIHSGADIVIELPTIFAVSSAENFAYGGVKIAQQLDCNMLSFGSECADINKLSHISNIIEDPKIRDKIKKNLANGNNYAKSVADATLMFDDDNILDKPNNLLAVEYIRACRMLMYNPELFTIKREDNFNSNQIQHICSATAIRNAVIENRLSDTIDSIPKYVFGELKKFNYKKTLENYHIFAHNYLQTCSKQYLSQIEGITEGLENRIIDCLMQPTYEQMLLKLKTKRYTMARLERVILNSILNITKQLVDDAKSSQLSLKVLAINSNRLNLLQDVPSITSIYIDEITNKADRIYSSLNNTEYSIKQNTNINKVSPRVDV